MVRLNNEKGGSMRKKLLKTVAVCAVLLSVLLAYPFAGYAEDKEHKTQPASEQRFSDIDMWVKVFEDPERDKWQKDRKSVV